MKYGIQDSKTKLWLRGVKPKYGPYELPYWDKESSASLADSLEVCQKWFEASQKRVAANGQRIDMSNAVVRAERIVDDSVNPQISLFG